MDDGDLATAAMDAYPPFEWIDVATNERVATEIQSLRGATDRRFDAVDAHFERVDAEFVGVRAETDLGFANFTRMMVYGFVATIVANAGVVAAIVGAGS